MFSESYKNEILNNSYQSKPQEKRLYSSLLIADNEWKMIEKLDYAFENIMPDELVETKLAMSNGQISVLIIYKK